MTVIGSAYIAIKPDPKGFEGDTEKGVTGAMGGIASRAAGVLKKGMIGAGVAIGAGVGAAIGLGFQRLSGIEEAQAKLRGLGHDARTVDMIMVNALGSVKGTAFGLADAATAAAGAVASGVKPGQDLQRTLGLVGDAATIAGVGFNEMGAIFNKVGASNRLTMGEVNQLADRGIPIMQWLADQYGVTGDEARKMVESGKVDFAAFRTAIETNIGGAALKSGETTKGAFENMKAALGRLGAAFLGPVFEKAKVLFGGLTGFLDDLTAKVGPFADTFAAGMQSAFVYMQTTVLPILGQVAGFIRDYVVPIVATVLVGAFNTAAAVIPVVVAVFQTLVGALSNPIFQVVAGAIALTLIPALVTLGIAATITAAQAVVAWATMTASSIAGSVSTYAALVRAGLQWIWLGVTSLASAAQAAAAWLIAMGPIALVVAAVIAAAVLIVRNWDWIKETVGNVVGAIGGFLGNLIGRVAGFAAQWGWILMGPIGVVWRFRDEISGVVSAVIGFFGRLVSGVAGKVGEMISFVAGIPGRVRSAIGDLGNLLYNAGRQIIAGLLRGIVDGAQAVYNYVSGIAGKIARLKGPIERDRRLLIPAGEAIMAGLENTIAARQRVVEARVRELTRGIARAGQVGAGGVVYASTSGAGASGVPEALVTELRSLVAAVERLAGGNTWNVSGSDPYQTAAVIERRMSWAAGG